MITIITKTPQSTEVPLRSIPAGTFFTWSGKLYLRVIEDGDHIISTKSGTCIDFGYQPLDQTRNCHFGGDLSTLVQPVSVEISYAPTAL